MTSRRTRRSVLKASGTLTTLGAVGVGSARSHGRGRGRSDDRGQGRGSGSDELRLFSEQAVDGASEVVTQGVYAYVATGEGFGVVDWRNPGRPELVATRDAPGSGIADVKVDGDLLAVGSQDGAEPSDIGTHFYDVGDPTDPQYLSTFQVLPAGVHNQHLSGDVCYIAKEFPFDESDLRIVDVSDPTDPTLLAKWAVEDEHPELDQPTNFVHDVFVQNDLAYLAYWDAGTRLLDVSDPTNPTEVSAFGVAPDAGEDVPFDFDNAEFVRRLLGSPGNSHYVQPSPDGNYVYDGAETYINDSGDIRVWDVSDLDTPRKVATIEALDLNDGTFADTSHNFDVTANRIHTSWYRGGVRVYDITDPTDPSMLATYDPEGGFYWTAVADRGFTIGSDIGGGLVFLHNDRGKQRPPGFAGDAENGAGPGPGTHAGPE
jgi:hypothetical protein